MQGAFWIANSKETLENAIQHLRDQWDSDKYLRIQVKTGKQRTLPQNALYWVWCTEASKFFKLKGTEKFDPKEQMDLVFKSNCHDRVTLEVTDKLSVDGQLFSTSDAETAEMFSYMERVQAWAAEFGCPLQSTGEYAENRERGMM